MERKVYLNEIYVYYRELFTDKQKEYFDLYSLEDLSLGEIAEQYGVSRNAVFNQIKIVEDRLEYYEKVIGLKNKKEQVLQIIKNEVSNEIFEKVEEVF